MVLLHILHLRLLQKNNVLELVLVYHKKVLLDQILLVIKVFLHHLLHLSYSLLEYFVLQLLLHLLLLKMHQKQLVLDIDYLYHLNFLEGDLLGECFLNHQNLVG
jgi:hypothetical protein